MGGLSSTRWGMTVTRATTEGLPRLDVRALARAGGLRPGTVATVTWGDGAAIATAVAAHRPDLVILRYDTGRHMERWRPICEVIPLVTTPCTFGGERVWFTCPGCGGRCAVLYALSGHFRCRACHQLAYASTRRPAIQPADGSPISPP